MGRQDKRHSADSATAEDQCHPRKIFVGGLAHKTTTQHIRDHFIRYGSIVDAVVLRWPDGRSRGFGYATFADAGSASAALRETHHIGGRQVDVKRAVPGTNKLFVGGLPQNTSATELREYFERFGVVSDAVVMIDPATSRSRGFGFICFLPGQEGAAAATSCLEQYDKHRLRGKWIEVKSASPPHKLAAKDGTSTSSVSEECELATAEEAAPPLHPGGRPLASPHRGRARATGANRGGGGTGPFHGEIGSRQLGEPLKVALPSPPPANPPSSLLPSGLLCGSGEPTPPGLQQHSHELRLQQQQQQLQQQQLAWFAAAAMAMGVPPPTWQSHALLGGLAASPPPLGPPLMSLAGTVATQPGADVAADKAAPEFRQNLEQLLRQSFTSDRDAASVDNGWKREFKQVNAI